MGGGTRLPARKVGHQNEFFFPQRIQGLVHGCPSPRSIKPAVTGAVFTTILRQQARQGQVQKALGSPEKGKGLTKVLSLQERGSVVMKKKRIDYTLLMEKGQAHALLNKINVLMPKVVPPLLLGYLLWDHSGVAEIYKSMQEYTNGTLDSFEPIKVELEQMAQRMGEADSTIEGNQITKGLIEAAQRAKQEIKLQAAATMPEDNCPNQIALWVAGILLAVAIASIKRASDDQ